MLANKLRIILLAIPLALAACATPPLAPDTEADRIEIPASPQTPKADTLSVRAVGDVMLGSDFPADRLPANDGRDLLAPVADILRDADITFANVEGVLMDGGEPEKTCNDPSLCYLFRSPSRYADTLAWAGVDVASLANNHARDFGEAGRSASMQALARAGLAHTGRAGDIASLEVNGLMVAVAGFAPNIGSWPILDIEGARHLVEGLAIGHDIVIVSFHGGAEGADAVYVPAGMETYYGEQRGDLRAFSHAVIDAGADLVIGHGPHVPRGLELYKGRLIAYSLGNFATHWGISVSGRKGYAPILDTRLDAQGRFLEGWIISAIQRRPDGVFIDDAQRAMHLMRELTREDFAGGSLEFGENGRLLPKASSPPQAGEPRYSR